MSNSELPQSSRSARAGGQQPETQSLIGLLENLVPLLLRLQSQTTQPFQVPAPDPLIQSAILDHQAAVAFTEDVIADALHNVATYVEANAKRYPALEPVRAIAEQARQSAVARDYSFALALILQVYRAVTALRLQKSDLPPIGRGADIAKSVH
jgi:hypothetical protein